MSAEKILIGYGQGVVATGEVTAVLLWPLNETLVREFLRMTKRGEISRTQALKLVQFLREKTQQYFNFISQLEGVLQETAVH